ncbi:Transcriptional regulator, XRE family [Candidatus Roizmanbacteria bacterium]|nr:Transcriptional regulator, XRE family [Candidatus Roizmanbacteria bacterium]
MNQSLINTVLKGRNKKKITQEELAHAVGVTRQTIIAIEKGNYTPSVLLALKIAKYFHTTTEKLFIIKE